MKFIKVYCLPFLLIAVLFSSCKKEENDPEVAKNCILLRISQKDDLNESALVYGYNGQRKLNEVYEMSNGYSSSYSSAIEYNVDGKISRINNIYNNKITNYETYEYDANGHLIKRNDFYSLRFGDTLKLQDYYTYEYDEYSRIKKRSKFDASNNQMAGYELFNYTEFTRASKYAYKTGANGTDFLGNVEYTFDNKKGYIYLLGVVKEENFDLKINDERMSPHNIVRQKAFILPYNDYDYTYEYSEDGFPVKLTFSEPGRGLRVSTFMYDCE